MIYTSLLARHLLVVISPYPRRSIIARSAPARRPRGARLPRLPSRSHPPHQPAPFAPPSSPGGNAGWTVIVGIFLLGLVAFACSCAGGVDACVDGATSTGAEAVGRDYRLIFVHQATGHSVEFPAAIQSFTDIHTPEFSERTFAGRMDPIYQQSAIIRNIDFTFVVANAKL